MNNEAIRLATRAAWCGSKSANAMRNVLKRWPPASSTSIVVEFCMRAISPCADTFPCKSEYKIQLPDEFVPVEWAT